MKLEGERILPADRQTVWEALNNPEVLRQAIPGCQSLDAEDDTHLTATVGVKIGPVSAKFNGKVELQDIVVPESYTLVGSGSGGAAGSARGEAKVKLQDHDEGCLMTYHVDAAVSGKLAQLGQRMIDPVARKLAEQFFDRFAELVTPASTNLEHASEDVPQMSDEPAPANNMPNPEVPSGGIPQWAWMTALAAAVAAFVIVYFS